MDRRTLVSGIILGPVFAGLTWPPSGGGILDHEMNEEALWRLQNARDFLQQVDRMRSPDVLYQAGVVSQLALTAYLLAVGWSDDDCLGHIGLNVGKALLFANSTGLGFRSDGFSRLVPLLSPYGRWRAPYGAGLPEIGSIDTVKMSGTLEHLLWTVQTRLADRAVDGVGP